MRKALKSSSELPRYSGSMRQGDVGNKSPFIALNFVFWDLLIIKLY